jgi:hypothetical protein
MCDHFGLLFTFIGFLAPKDIAYSIFQLGNPVYTPTTLTKEEILDNHRSVLCSFGISNKDEELDLPSLYSISKLHKCPFKQLTTSGVASVTVALKPDFDRQYNTC